MSTPHPVLILHERLARRRRLRAEEEARRRLGKPEGAEAKPEGAEAKAEGAEAPDDPPPARDKKGHFVRHG